MNENEAIAYFKNNDFHKTLLNELFVILNDKESNVIQKRFVINEKEQFTLEKIGQEYGITRERVRQIEKEALTKLTRIAKKTHFIQLLELTDKILQENSYVMTESALLASVIKYTGGLFVDSPGVIRLSFAINNNLKIIKKSLQWHKTIYVANKVSLKQLKTILKTGKESLKLAKQIQDPTSFIKNLQTTLKDKKVNLSRATIESTLSMSKSISLIEEGYGLNTWRTVRPKSIKDKALIVLKRSKKPLHFKEIAKLITHSAFDKKQVTVQAVHNELIRYDEFVLVGRGIYALRKWGFKDGTVKDVIVDILKDSGPLSKNKIVQEVLKRRQVKVGTISLNLQKYPEFKRVGRAIYTLANNMEK